MIYKDFENTSVITLRILLWQDDQKENSQNHQTISKFCLTCEKENIKSKNMTSSFLQLKVSKQHEGRPEVQIPFTSSLAFNVFEVVAASALQPSR